MGILGGMTADIGGIPVVPAFGSPHSRIRRGCLPGPPCSPICCFCWMIALSRSCQNEYRNLVVEENCSEPVLNRRKAQEAMGGTPESATCWTGAGLSTRRFGASGTDQSPIRSAGLLLMYCWLSTTDSWLIWACNGFTRTSAERPPTFG